jgi:hypothetical protein
MRYLELHTEQLTPDITHQSRDKESLYKPLKTNDIQLLFPFTVLLHQSVYGRFGMISIPVSMPLQAQSSHAYYS